MPDLIAILDRDHRIVRVNRAMAVRLGKTPAECIGLTCYESFHGCTQPIKGCPHALTMADGQDHIAELHEERLQGDFLVTTSPFRDAEDRMIGVVHVARDISERKQAEAREREALALASASQTAVDILDAMGEGVLLVDMQGAIVSANPALEKMTGVPTGEAIGQQVSRFFPLSLIHI